MNLGSLQVVRFGDIPSLHEFLFENGVEHQTFWNELTRKGYAVPKLPIMDADTANLDDWLLYHYREHDQMAKLLNLQNPINLLDTDWNVEVDFYDWVSTHYIIHSQIISALGL